VVLSGERAEILAVQFNPGVGPMIEGLDGQADDELRRISLLTQEAVQDQRIGEAGGSPGTQVQGTEDSSPEAKRWDAVAGPRRDASQPCDELRKWFARVTERDA